MLAAWMCALVFCSSAVAGPHSDGPAQVFSAGTVVTADAEGHLVLHRPGRILVEEGRIRTVGRDVAIPPGATLRSFGDNAWITPGLVDASSRLLIGDDSLDLALDPAYLVASAGEEALALAQAGVTTVVLQPRQPASSGSRAVAVKTAGSSRAGRVVSPLTAIVVPWSQRTDPADVASRLERALSGGQKYAKQWTDYAAELAAWEKARAEGAKIEVVDAPKPRAKTERRADALSGVWELESEGRRGPTIQRLVLTLGEDGTTVTAQLAGGGGRRGGGDRAPPPDQLGRGTWRAPNLRVEFEEREGPGGRGGAPILTATVQGETMEGSLAFGERFSREFTGQRTERTVQEITTYGRRPRLDDGRPTPPPTRPELEPYRALFAGDAALWVQVNDALALRHARRVADQFKVGLVVAPAATLALDADQLHGLRGVVAPIGSPLDTAHLQQAGVPCAFRSIDGSSNATLDLLLGAQLAVHRGADPLATLHAVTTGAAQLAGAEARVGGLRPGQDADLLVFDGDPFTLTTRLLGTWVDGQRVDTAR